VSSNYNLKSLVAKSVYPNPLSSGVISSSPPIITRTPTPSHPLGQSFQLNVLLLRDRISYARIIKCGPISTFTGFMSSTRAIQRAKRIRSGDGSRTKAMDVSKASSRPGPFRNSVFCATRSRSSGFVRIGRM
jgi:hypothetical protein